MSEKVIRLHGDDEPAGGTVTFDIAVVPAHVHDIDNQCPYCAIKDQDYVIDYIDIKKTDRKVDIIQCAECEEIYLVVENPILLEAKRPVFTKWHIVDQNLI